MYLTDSPLQLQPLIDEVMRASDGACVTFIGAVRNHHHGKSVASIEYEAYRPMAEKELAKIVDALRSENPAVAIAVRHRLGHLTVGEASIMIACSASHRSEAFAVCRGMIDRIKQTVPIWKKERSESGEEWVGWQWS
jgi:molybdopterin synthase catalytic subunit